MTPPEFKAIRKTAGLTQAQLANLLHVTDIRTLRRYENGERKVTGPISLLMALIDRDGVEAVRALASAAA